MFFKFTNEKKNDILKLKKIKGDISMCEIKKPYNDMSGIEKHFISLYGEVTEWQKERYEQTVIFAGGCPNSRGLCSAVL